MFSDHNKIKLEITEGNKKISKHLEPKQYTK